MFRNWIIGASALALTAVPVAASAAPVANAAQSLSVSKSIRSGTATRKSNKLAGASIVPIIIGVGIVAGVTYLIVDKENDDDSDSN